VIGFEQDPVAQGFDHSAISGGDHTDRPGFEVLDEIGKLALVETAADVAEPDHVSEPDDLRCGVASPARGGQQPVGADHELAAPHMALQPFQPRPQLRDRLQNRQLCLLRRGGVPGSVLGEGP
jgi:hypothetical protein